MNCYTRILNSCDLELINYDQTYFNLTIVSKNILKKIEIMNNYEHCNRTQYENIVFEIQFFNKSLNNDVLGLELYELY